MDSVAERILETREVVDSEGRSYPLRAHTERKQGERIQEAIRELRPDATLETGMAYGISTLFICEALRSVGGNKHFVMDPNQATDWHGIGLKNVRDAGYEDLVEFRPEESQVVLPDLVKRGVRVGLAYLDADKVFDRVLVNTFYLFRLLEPGGLMVLDDCNRPGLRKICRLLAKAPFLEVAWIHRQQAYHPRRQALSRLTRSLPLARQILAPELLETDRDLGVDASCVAFRKLSEDGRHWTWHESF